MMCAVCQDKVCLKGEKCDEINLYNSREENIKVYLENKGDRRLMESSACIPKDIPRVEEVARYIDHMDIKKVGIAFCKGLQKEARLIHGYLEERGIEVYSVICGNEGIDKGELRIEKKSEAFEISCNPLGQGGVLNKAGTELNIAVGLCVGHDMLFSKYSEAPVTTLVVKDRVNSHNPLAALKEIL